MLGNCVIIDLNAQVDCLVRETIYVIPIIVIICSLILALDYFEKHKK